MTRKMDMFLIVPDGWTDLTGLTEKQTQKALDNLVKLGYLDIRTIKENDIERAI